MNKARNGRYYIARCVIYLILIILAVSYLYPLFFIAINSIKDQTGYMINPFSISFKDAKYSNYVTIFRNFHIGKYLLNTLFVTVMKIALSLPLSIFASYAFAKLHFKGQKIVYPAVMIAMFIPFQVIMIPVYVMLARVGLLDTFAGLIIVSGTLSIPGTILLLTANFRAIPTEMLEAATIDGCGYFRRVWNVVVPMGIPAISINVVMNFIGSWNDLLAPMVILKSLDHQLVMPALNNLVSRYNKDVPLQLAGMMIATVPAVAIYLIMQKRIIMGITAGSIK